jgi:hypothetical protein
MVKYTTISEVEEDLEPMLPSLQPVDAGEVHY